MFARKFMRVFAVRKYAEPTAKGDSVVSDYIIGSKIEETAMKIAAFFLGFFLFTQAHERGHAIQKWFGDIPRPPAFIIYKFSVQKDVRKINQDIIDKMRKINKVKQTIEDRTPSTFVGVDKDGKVVI